MNGPQIPSAYQAKVRHEAGTGGTTHLAGESRANGFSVFWNRGSLPPNVASQEKSYPAEGHRPVRCQAEGWPGQGQLGHVSKALSQKYQRVAEGTAQW